MSDEPENKTKTGYRKPPMEHCFQPGTSGNRKGRPKGSKNKPLRIDDQRVDDMILQEVFRPVKVRENGRLIEMPILRAAVRTMAIQAAAGNVRSARTLLHAVIDVMGRRKKLHDEYRETAIKYINETKAEIRELRTKKLSIDHISPHPDDFLWDEEMGLPYLPDPATEPSVEDNRNTLASADMLIGSLERTLADASSAEEVAGLRSQLSKLMDYRELLAHKIKRQEARQKRDWHSDKS